MKKNADPTPEAGADHEPDARAGHADAEGHLGHRRLHAGPTLKLILFFITLEPRVE